MDPHTNTHATATGLVADSTLQPDHDHPTPSTEPQQPSFFASSTASHAAAPPITDRDQQQSVTQFVDEGTDPLPPTPLMMPAPALVRQETAEPIGPSTDLPTPMPQTPGFGTPSGPVITINLLLSSTGTRHPYRIDQKYLAKRNVTAENENGEFDPFVISVYTLKELIWRDWREEWEPKPSSPAAIRLIHFGRFLDDKLPLKECRFSDSTPNVVHMSVKPQEVIDDEENAKSAKGKNSGGGARPGSRGHGDEPTAGCRCVVQ
ncbi:hypothetical protein QM012_004451 [Aureobasidium pullulans]|uniref:UBL3-like ubiquitin domain-containing protein n=1 Tax=Aureobasidium pullulans TaxID=5580 RepID=A0ABR0TTA0_AURPU